MVVGRGAAAAGASSEDASEGFPAEDMASLDQEAQRADGSQRQGTHLQLPCQLQALPSAVPASKCVSLTPTPPLLFFLSRFSKKPKKLELQVQLKTLAGRPGEGENTTTQR